MAHLAPSMPGRRLRDDYLHLGHRRRLVQHLRHRGIDDVATLDAIGRVPRHFFVPRAHEARAYEDRALPIGHGQTISQPYTVAFQTSVLRARRRQKVLEIGTGSGYQAAVLGALGLRVFTLERQEALYHRTRALLSAHDFGRIRCFLRDGYRGLPAYAPFDRILVTAGASDIPEVLLGQLAPGGIMVVPVGDGDQVMKRITRPEGGGAIVVEDLGAFRFVPFLGGLVPLE